MLYFLLYLASRGYEINNLWHSSTQKDSKWVEKKSKFNFMPHIITKFTKCLIRTFYYWKSGYRTKITFLQLWEHVQKHPHILIMTNVVRFQLFQLLVCYSVCIRCVSIVKYRKWVQISTPSIAVTKITKYWGLKTFNMKDW